jgi:hypothetical protein
VLEIWNFGPGADYFQPPKTYYWPPSPRDISALFQWKVCLVTAQRAHQTVSRRGAWGETDMGDRRIGALIAGAAGAFFFASGFQTSGLFGQQVCPSACIHAEWIAIGIGLLGVAYYLWTQSKP